jgi:hypothetical protein
MQRCVVFGSRPLAIIGSEVPIECNVELHLRLANLVVYLCMRDQTSNTWVKATSVHNVHSAHYPPPVNVTTIH